MTDIVGRLRRAIHLESAAIAPQTSALIEGAKLAIDEIERLRAERDKLFAKNGELANTLGAENLRLQKLVNLLEAEIDRLRAQNELGIAFAREN